MAISRVKTLGSCIIEPMTFERLKGLRKSANLKLAISRVKTLGSCIIEPMTFERLKGLRKSANLKYRLEEEKRLDELAQKTCRNLIKK